MKKSVLHDSDVHRHPQMLRLRAEGGWNFYGMYWGLIEWLRENAMIELRLNEIALAAMGTGIPQSDLEDLINACARAGVAVENNGAIAFPGYAKRVKAYEDKCEADRQRKRGGKSSENKRKETESARNANSNYNSNSNSSDIYINEFRDPHTLTPNQSTELLGNFADGRDDWLQHQVQLAKAKLGSKKIKVECFFEYMKAWLLRAKANYDDGPEKFGKAKSSPKTKTERNLEILARTL